MLAITLVLGVVSIVAVYWASRVSMGVGADIAGRRLHPCPGLLGPGDEPFRHAVAHHP